MSLNSNMIRRLKDKWAGVSEEGLFEAIQDCLTKGADLRASEFTVDDIWIDYDANYVQEKDRSELYITTLKIPQKRNKHANVAKRRLLVISGYCGSAICMFPMFQKLSEYFEITTIDVLGFGCSGRPDFNMHTIDGVLSWFTW